MRQSRVELRYGKPLGEETYRITIKGGVIVDRRRAEPEDTCNFESYRPI